MPDTIYAAITLFVIIFAIAGLFITRFSGGIVREVVAGKVSIPRTIYMRYFSTLTILFFLLMLIRGGFVAPNINLPTEYLSLGVLLQSLIVLSATVSIGLSGFFILITTVTMVVLIPFAISVNYVFEFVAIGIFMMMTGHHISVFDSKLATHYNLATNKTWHTAVTVLRIGIGLQLVVLAYTEKIAYPGLALVFVEMFPFYNFFPSIGLAEVTDLHFVWFVGLCELVLGLFLMFGLASRLTIIMLTFAFVTTAVIHGAHEIEGHLPIFAAAVILLFELRTKSPQNFAARLRPRFS
ncbi:hypothetical protein [Vibrio paucivorans]